MPTVHAIAGIAHRDDARECHQRRLVRPFAARYQHLQISRMRAMEAGRPMVRAANDGVSAVIGHRGEIIASAPEYEANVMRAELQPRIGLTPYARTGTGPSCVWPLFSALAAYLKRRASKA
jgi:apolipoprotein N-acyltransferase